MTLIEIEEVTHVEILGGVPGANGSGGRVDVILPGHAVTVTGTAVEPRVHVDEGDLETVRKRAPGVVTYESDAVPVYEIETCDLLVITAQATDLALDAGMVGTPAEGQPFQVRVCDDGIERALAYGSDFVGIYTGLVLPTVTEAGKTMTLGFIYHDDRTAFVLVALLIED